MAKRSALRIVIVNALYSEGMGYLENCLPVVLARSGHDVHVVTSTYHQYANEPMYDETYRTLLGPRQVAPAVSVVDGYRLHRLDAGLVSGYVRVKGLTAKIAELSPDVVYSCEIASLETFALALDRLRRRYRLFCGTHQTVSTLKSFLKRQRGARLRKAVYWATRTLPTSLASMAVERCYAHTPDCLEVAARFYGVPRAKLVLRSLGTDPELFHPPNSAVELSERRILRERLGFTDSDIVCVYSGRFSPEKNPVVLAQAIAALSRTDQRFKGLFIGDGAQKAQIIGCLNSQVIPFVRYEALASHFRAADIAVWPRQESMSMLDAASCALPVIVSNTMGEPARVAGNGKTYEEDSVASLVDVLRSFADFGERHRYGARGRERMIERFSWVGFARELECDFLSPPSSSRPPQHP